MEIDGKSRMEFKDLCDCVYPILKGVCKSRYELFDFLVLNCIDEENEKLADDLSRLSSKQKANITNGKAPFDHVAARISPCFGSYNLEEALSASISLSGTMDHLDNLRKLIPDINCENYSEKIGDAMHLIIKSCANRYRNQRVISDIKLCEKLIEEEDGKCALCGLSFHPKQIMQESSVLSFSEKGESPFETSLLVCHSCFQKTNPKSSRDALKQIKQKCKKDFAIRNSLSTFEIEDDLASAVKSLLAEPPEGFSQIKYKSLKIDEKINPSKEPILSSKVKSMVSIYYSVLKNLFQEYDGNNGNSFETLSLNIRIAYLKLKKAELASEQIFDSLVDLIKRRAGCSTSVSEVIVCFFIQNCEVFDEIPQ